MTQNGRTIAGKLLVAPLLLLTTVGASAIPFASCGPFTDVGTLICPFVLELYYSGITAGTTATTFSPNDPVTRGQMAIFTATTLDLSLTRSSRRAALNQWWTTTPHYDAGLGLTTVGSAPVLLKCDGADIWVAASGDNTVTRVRASDGAVSGTWTGATSASGVVVAMGRIFVTGNTSPGALYVIDPSQPPGAVTVVINNLGDYPYDVVFDGSSIWTANNGGSVSRVTPGTSPGSWNVATFATGFVNPLGTVFDGTNIWVTDVGDNSLKRVASDGSVAQLVAMASNPFFPCFDGKNVWVPTHLDSSLSVVRASDGAVLQTFSAANGNQNGLWDPVQAAFDGQRILVSNFGGGLSIFKASDLSIVGNVATPGLADPWGVATNGVNFWISGRTSLIARF